MGWICPGCGSEISFEVEVCRACGYRAHPAHLAGERLATVWDRLQANRFDFFGRSLEERAWDRARRAASIWRGIFPYMLIVEAVLVVILLLFSGMPGLFDRLPHWQDSMATVPQVLLGRGGLAWENLLYDWRMEEERVQAAIDGLDIFTESTAARTEELTRRVEEDWSATGEAAAALKSRFRAGFHPGRVTDRVKESETLVLGGRQGVERRAETREQAKERIAQYQATFTQRAQEITEKVTSRLLSLGNG